MEALVEMHITRSTYHKILQYSAAAIFESREFPGMKFVTNIISMHNEAGCGIRYYLF